MLVLVCGPPGSGKTTLTEAVRTRLTAAGYDVAVFHSDDYTRHTYDRLERDVDAHDGHAIVDATLYKPEWRERFRALADDVFVLAVTADKATCLRRNRDRDDPISDTGVHAIYATFDEHPVDADVTIDTDALDVDAAADHAAERIEARLTR